MSGVLRVDGLVTIPCYFGFESLRAIARQLVEPSALLAGREGGAVPLEALLEAAGVRAGAQSIVAESDDGSYVTTMPFESMRQCVIFYRIAEAPLPRGLGGPYRLMTSGRVGSGDVKALGSIYVSDRRFVDVDDTERVCVRVTRAA